MSISYIPNRRLIISQYLKIIIKDSFSEKKYGLHISVFADFYRN